MVERVNLPIIGNATGSLMLIRYGSIRKLQGTVNDIVGGNDITDRLSSIDRPIENIDFLGVSTSPGSSLRISPTGRVIAYGTGTFHINAVYIVD